MDRSKFRLELFAFLPFVAALAVLIALKPYFGLADDWSFLVFLDNVSKAGLWYSAIQYIQGDYSWGMIRPYYPFVSYLFYSAGNVSPLLMYVLNWAVVTAIVSLLGFAFSRLFFPESDSKRRTFFFAFVAAYLLMPQASFIFIIAAMQEKWVLLLAALNVLWFIKQDDRSSTLSYYLGSTAFLVLGFLMKAQFAMIIPALFLILLLKATLGRLSFLRAGFILVPSVGCLVALKHVANQGSYTSQFGSGSVLTRVMENLRAPQFLGLIIIGAAWLVFASLKKNWPRWQDRILWLLPSLFIFSFLAIFLQWRYAGYLMASIAFVTALMCALAVTGSKLSLQLPMILLLSLASTAVTTLRLSERAGAYGSLSEFLNSEAIQKVSRDKTPVFISCPEAAVAMKTYAKRLANLDINFVSVDTVKADTQPPLAFRDHKFCPLLPTFPEGTVVWTSTKPNSFQLVDLTRGKS